MPIILWSSEHITLVQFKFLHRFLTLVKQKQTINCELESIQFYSVVFLQLMSLTRWGSIWILLFAFVIYESHTTLLEAYHIDIN